MNFAEHVAEDRRLVILRILDGAPGYSANDSVLQSALDQFAHVVSRDVVLADIAWLEEAGLITAETVGARTRVAKLTPRGHDVATGRARHPGVKRPAPSAS